MMVGATVLSQHTVLGCSILIHTRRFRRLGYDVVVVVMEEHVFCVAYRA